MVLYQLRNSPMWYMKTSYTCGTWQCWFYILYCTYNVFNIVLLLYLHTLKYGYTFYITIKTALHVTGTFLLEGGKKFCMFNIKHKIIIIPQTKLENDAQKPKHVINYTYTALINYYENICIQEVIFFIDLILHITQCN